MANYQSNEAMAICPGWEEIDFADNKPIVVPYNPAIHNKLSDLVSDLLCAEYQSSEDSAEYRDPVEILENINIEGQKKADNMIVTRGQLFGALRQQICVNGVGKIEEEGTWYWSWNGMVAVSPMGKSFGFDSIVLLPVRMRMTKGVESLHIYRGVIFLDITADNYLDVARTYNRGYYQPMTMMTYLQLLSGTTSSTVISVDADGVNFLTKEGKVYLHYSLSTHDCVEVGKTYTLTTLAYFEKKGDVYYYTAECNSKPVFDMDLDPLTLHRSGKNDRVFDKLFQIKKNQKTLNLEDGRLEEIAYNNKWQIVSGDVTIFMEKREMTKEVVIYNLTYKIAIKVINDLPTKVTTNNAGDLIVSKRPVNEITAFMLIDLAEANLLRAAIAGDGYSLLPNSTEALMEFAYRNRRTNLCAEIEKLICDKGADSVFHTLAHMKKRCVIKDCEFTVKYGITQSMCDKLEEIKFSFRVTETTEERWYNNMAKFVNDIIKTFGLNVNNLMLPLTKKNIGFMSHMAKMSGGGLISVLLGELSALKLFLVDCNFQRIALTNKKNKYNYLPAKAAVLVLRADLISDIVEFVIREYQIDLRLNLSAGQSGVLKLSHTVRRTDTEMVLKHQRREWPEEVTRKEVWVSSHANIADETTECGSVYALSVMSELSVPETLQQEAIEMSAVETAVSNLAVIDTLKEEYEKTVQEEVESKCTDMLTTLLEDKVDLLEHIEQTIEKEVEELKKEKQSIEAELVKNMKEEDLLKSVEEDYEKKADVFEQQDEYVVIQEGLSVTENVLSQVEKEEYPNVAAALVSTALVMDDMEDVALREAEAEFDDEGRPIVEELEQTEAEEQEYRTQTAADKYEEDINEMLNELVVKPVKQDVRKDTQKGKYQKAAESVRKNRRKRVYQRVFTGRRYGDLVAQYIHKQAELKRVASDKAATQVELEKPAMDIGERVGEIINTIKSDVEKCKRQRVETLLEKKAGSVEELEGNEALKKTMENIKDVEIVNEKSITLLEVVPSVVDDTIVNIDDLTFDISQMKAKLDKLRIKENMIRMGSARSEQAAAVKAQIKKLLADIDEKNVMLALQKTKLNHVYETLFGDEKKVISEELRAKLLEDATPEMVEILEAVEVKGTELSALKKSVTKMAIEVSGAKGNEQYFRSVECGQIMTAYTMLKGIQSRLMMSMYMESFFEKARRIHATSASGATNDLARIYYKDEAKTKYLVKIPIQSDKLKREDNPLTLIEDERTREMFLVANERLLNLLYVLATQKTKNEDGMAHVIVKDRRELSDYNVASFRRGYFGYYLGSDYVDRYEVAEDKIAILDNGGKVHESSYERGVKKAQECSVCLSSFDMAAIGDLLENGVSIYNIPFFQFRVAEERDVKIPESLRNGSLFKKMKMSELKELTEPETRHRLCGIVKKDSKSSDDKSTTPHTDSLCKIKLKYQGVSNAACEKKVSEVKSRVVEAGDVLDAGALAPKTPRLTGVAKEQAQMEKSLLDAVEDNKTMIDAAVGQQALYNIVTPDLPLIVKGAGGYQPKRELVFQPYQLKCHTTTEAKHIANAVGKSPRRVTVRSKQRAVNLVKETSRLRVPNSILTDNEEASLNSAVRITPEISHERTLSMYAKTEVIRFRYRMMKKARDYHLLFNWAHLDYESFDDESDEDEVNFQSDYWREYVKRLGQKALTATWSNFKWEDDYVDSSKRYIRRVRKWLTNWCQGDAQHVVLADTDPRTRQFIVEVENYVAEIVDARRDAQRWDNVPAVAMSISEDEIKDNRTYEGFMYHHNDFTKGTPFYSSMRKWLKRYYDRTISWVPTVENIRRKSQEQTIDDRIAKGLVKPSEKERLLAELMAVEKQDEEDPCDTVGVTTRIGKKWYKRQKAKRRLGQKAQRATANVMKVGSWEIKRSNGGTIMKNTSNWPYSSLKEDVEEIVMPDLGVDNSLSGRIGRALEKAKEQTIGHVIKCGEMMSEVDLKNLEAHAKVHIEVRGQEFAVVVSFCGLSNITKLPKRIVVATSSAMARYYRKLKHTEKVKLERFHNYICEHLGYSDISSYDSGDVDGPAELSDAAKIRRAEARRRRKIYKDEMKRLFTSAKERIGCDDSSENETHEEHRRRLKKANIFRRIHTYWKKPGIKIPISLDTSDESDTTQHPKVKTNAMQRIRKWFAGIAAENVDGEDYATDDIVSAVDSVKSEIRESVCNYIDGKNGYDSARSSGSDDDYQEERLDDMADDIGVVDVDDVELAAAEAIRIRERDRRKLQKAEEEARLREEDEKERSETGRVGIKMKHCRTFTERTGAEFRRALRVQRERGHNLGVGGRGGTLHWWNSIYLMMCIMCLFGFGAVNGQYEMSGFSSDQNWIFSVAHDVNKCIFVSSGAKELFIGNVMDIKNDYTCLTNRKCNIVDLDQDEKYGAKITAEGYSAVGDDTPVPWKEWCNKQNGVVYLYSKKNFKTEGWNYVMPPPFDEKVTVVKEEGMFPDGKSFLYTAATDQIAVPIHIYHATPNGIKLRDRDFKHPLNTYHSKSGLPWVCSVKKNSGYTNGHIIGANLMGPNEFFNCQLETVGMNGLKERTIEKEVREGNLDDVLGLGMKALRLCRDKIGYIYACDFLQFIDHSDSTVIYHFQHIDLGEKANYTRTVTEKRVTTWNFIPYVFKWVTKGMWYFSESLFATIKEYIPTGMSEFSSKYGGYVAESFAWCFKWGMAMIGKLMDGVVSVGEGVGLLSSAGKATSITTEIIEALPTQTPMTKIKLHKALSSWSSGKNVMLVFGMQTATCNKAYSGLFEKIFNAQGYHISVTAGSEIQDAQYTMRTSFISSKGLKVELDNFEMRKPDMKYMQIFFVQFNAECSMKDGDDTCRPMDEQLIAEQMAKVYGVRKGVYYLPLSCQRDSVPLVGEYAHNGAEERSLGLVGSMVQYAVEKYVACVDYILSVLDDCLYAVRGIQKIDMAKYRARDLKLQQQQKEENERQERLLETGAVKFDQYEYDMQQRIDAKIKEMQKQAEAEMYGDYIDKLFSLKEEDYHNNPLTFACYIAKALRTAYRSDFVIGNLDVEMSYIEKKLKDAAIMNPNHVWIYRTFAKERLGLMTWIMSGGARISREHGVDVSAANWHLNC